MLKFSCLGLALLLLSASVVPARIVRLWSDQELFDESDLVVLATCTATKARDEQTGLPGFPGQRVVRLETQFQISAVLKGDRGLKNLALEHYKLPEGANVASVPNGPTFISFVPATRTYLLFLRRQGEGPYAPVVGQTDPALAVKVVTPASP
jgi:hypothetical protein